MSADILYLTRAVLSPASRNIAALLRQASRADAGHSLIWSLFEQQEGGPARFLFRETEPGRRWLLLSQEVPTPSTDLWTLETREFQPDLAAGSLVRFSLRANPAVSVATDVRHADGSRMRGHRADAVMHARWAISPHERAGWTAADTEAAALAWLYAREERLGLAFDREACLAMAYRQQRVWRRGAEPVRFSTIDYEGVARVENPARLQAAMAHGVGRARRYGCGLLLVRPA